MDTVAHVNESVSKKKKKTKMLKQMKKIVKAGFVVIVVVMVDVLLSGLRILYHVFA